MYEMTECSLYKRWDIIGIGTGFQATFKIHLLETDFAIAVGNTLKLTLDN